MGQKKHLWLFIGFFVLFELTTYLANDMIMPAMMDITHEFHVSNNYVSLSLSLFILGGCLLQIFLAPIVDRLGKRQVLLCGNVLFLISTILAIFVKSMAMFLIFRLLQGMGMCFVFIGYALIHEYFDDIRAIKITSILGNIAITAPLIGPIIGSIIIISWSWHHIFIITATLGSIAFCGLLIYMPNGKIINKQLTFKIAINNYKKLFACRNFLVGVIVANMAWIPMVSWIGISPIIIIDSLGYSYAIYVLCQSIIFAGYILSCYLIQKMLHLFTFYNIVYVGNILFFTGLSLSCVFHDSLPLFIFAMFIYAIGFGIFYNSVIRISLISTDESLSFSTSIYTIIQSICLVIGLESVNLFCYYFGFALKYFSLANLFFGFISFIYLIKFAEFNKKITFSADIEAKPE